MNVVTDGARTKAFEQFFLAEHPKLVALGLAWSGNPDTARELAQESLARALRWWDRVSDLDVPGAWVRRVMINLLIDQRRGERREVLLLDRLDRPDDRDDPAPPDDRWWHAVRALPDRERAAVTLHYLEDLPIAEVAQILEIAPGTVKASLSHARQKLRTALSTSEEGR